MPDIIPRHVPSPRALLAWDGTAYRPIHISATGDIQVDVLSTAMDPLAATEATLASADAYLALITLIRNALQSVQTDRLIVRGEDQLFSFLGVLSDINTAVISGADGYIDSTPCPAGEVWCVTHVSSQDATTATTQHEYRHNHDGVPVRIGEVVAAIAAGDYAYWKCRLWLDPADTMRVDFTGGLAGDNCAVVLAGYRMTLET